jgi:hypothetical protein
VTVQALFIDEHRRLRPGASCTLTLSVTNLGPTEVTWAITPIGMAANWVRVQAPTVTLNPGASIPVAVDIEPPESALTTAGPTEILVKLVPISGVDTDSITADTIIEIEAFDRREIHALQPVRRGHRRSTFEFLITNDGNAPANCRLNLIDPTGRIDGMFDPPSIGIGPGSSALVLLRARAGGVAGRLADRELPFRVEAVEPEHPTVSTQATMVQSPFISTGLLARLGVAAGLVAAATAAWFGVIRPEINSVAERAVDARLDTSATAEGPDVDGAAPSMATGTPGGSDPLEIIIDPGTGAVPIAPRLEVTTPVGGIGADAYEVPADVRFDIVDIVLMNPNGDVGRAVLLRGDETVYEWDLGLMSMPNEYQPRQSPLPIEPGGTVSLRVECEGAGSLDADGCQVAVLLGGSLSAR